MIFLILILCCIREVLYSSLMTITVAGVILGRAAGRGAVPPHRTAGELPLPAAAGQPDVSAAAGQAVGVGEHGAAICSGGAGGAGRCGGDRRGGAAGGRRAVGECGSAVAGRPAFRDGPVGGMRA